MARASEITAGALHSVYPSLYGSGCNTEEMDSRWASLLEKYRKDWDSQEASLFSAAGRTELGGNHTDHNLGKVIAGTINLDTIAAARKSDDKKVRILSEGYAPITVDLSDLKPRQDEKNTTASLVRGIAAGFRDKGIAIGGFQASVTSRVAPGSGLSSSASIEVLIAEIFNHFYAGDSLSPLSLAQISQKAENVFFGKPSGLLDQIGCAMGGICGIDFHDRDNPRVTPLSFDFSAFGYDLAVVNVHGSHADLTGEYAAIPSEMKKVASCFGCPVLGLVRPEDFFRGIARVRSEVGNDRAVARAIHFFDENRRVDGMLEAIGKKDIDRYLRLVRESGESSYCLLQNVTVPGDHVHQSATLALALAKEVLGQESAVRIHGGGFGGTIQAYVPFAKKKEFFAAMDSLFGKGATTSLAMRSRPVCCVMD